MFVIVLATTAQAALMGGSHKPVMCWISQYPCLFCRVAAVSECQMQCAGVSQLECDSCRGATLLLYKSFLTGPKCLLLPVNSPETCCTVLLRNNLSYSLPK